MGAWSWTHWGRVTHICISRCISKLTTIGSDNGLLPDRLQAIIWTNAGILLIRPLGTNFSEIIVEILTFSFTKMGLKVSSAKWQPFWPGIDELNELQRLAVDWQQWYQNSSLSSTYRKASYISRTLVSNKIVDNSDVVGASPVGAAPTTSSFST